MEKTLFIAGEQDVKYKSIGQMMHKMLLAQYQEVAQSSHALLVEAPVQVADAIATYLLQNGTLSVKKNSLIEAPKPTKSRLKIVEAANSTPLWATSVDGITAVGALEYERFEIKILDDDSRSPILGSGWGRNSVPDASDRMVKRQGFIVQIACSNSLMNGLGEISPLKGLHNETIDDVHFQLAALHNALKQATVDNLPYFEANRILSLNGSLGIAIERLAELAKVDRFFPSVRSGLEMALISLAAQQGSFPIHQALAIYATKDIDKASSNMVSLSGFISRKLPTPWTSTKSAPFQRSFKSIKIKVGHQDLELDKLCLLQGFQKMERQLTGRNDGRIRADANRAWNESQVIAFATLLEGLDVHAIEKIEYIEEPLQKVQKSIMSPSGWTLGAQVAALERSFLQTNLQYAIDESLADVVMMCDGKFDDIKDVLKAVFENGPRGCAALVLKPSLLGYELAFQIAQFSRTELGIAAVFSSSFDSGLGLAHTAFLSNIVDKKGNAEIYPHGLGTFTILESDTITPSFESYVNNEGILNVPSLSRALFGLSLEEMRDSAAFPRDDSQQQALPTLLIEDEYRYEASTATSVSGKEISVAVSLPLPFSADTAWVRFTDLPSMSRWSPWITSVRYEGLEETEWVINVRGIPLKWRATSQLIYEPFKGIQWQSVSGLRNSGVVEFIPNVTGSMTSSSCVMNVRMTITPPRLFRPFLPQGSLFLEDFLRDRLLKWSLEMFRDVVKADLALERYEMFLSPT
jgi:O-succinylbenzoate synthase